MFWGHENKNYYYYLVMMNNNITTRDETKIEDEILSSHHHYHHSKTTLSNYDYENLGGAFDFHSSVLSRGLEIGWMC